MKEPRELTNAEKFDRMLTLKNRIEIFTTELNASKDVSNKLQKELDTLNAELEQLKIANPDIAEFFISNDSYLVNLIISIIKKGYIFRADKTKDAYIAIDDIIKMVYISAIYKDKDNKNLSNTINQCINRLIDARYLVPDANRRHVKFSENIKLILGIA